MILPTGDDLRREQYIEKVFADALKDKLKAIRSQIVSLRLSVESHKKTIEHAEYEIENLRTKELDLETELKEVIGFCPHCGDTK